MFLQLFKDYPIIIGVLCGVAIFIVAALLGCVFVKWHIRNKADIFFRVLFFLLIIAFIIPACLYIFSKTGALGIQVAVNGAGIDFFTSSGVIFYLPLGADILNVITTDAGFWFVCFNFFGSVLCFILSCIKGRTSKAIAFKKAKKEIKNKVEATEKAKMETSKPQMQYGEFVAFNNGGIADDQKDVNGEFNHNAFAEDGFSGGNTINADDFSVDFEEHIIKDSGVFTEEDDVFNNPVTKEDKENPVAYSVGFENVAYSEGNFDLFDGEDITKDFPDAFTELEMEEVHNSKKIFDSLVKLVESEPEVISPEGDVKTAPKPDEEPDSNESKPVLVEESYDLGNENLIQELLNDDIIKTEDNKPDENSSELLIEKSFEDGTNEEINELKEEIEYNREENIQTVETAPFERDSAFSEESKSYPEIKIRTVKINRPRHMEADIVKEEENPFKGAKSKKEIEVAPDAIKKKEPGVLKKGAQQNKKSAATTKNQAEKAEKEVEAEEIVLPLTRKHIILNRTNVVNVFSDYLKEKQREEKDTLENNISTIIIK